MSRQPEVLWAQRSEKIYLTISLPDAKDVVLKTEPQGLFTFSAVANREPFSFSLELFDSILPEGHKTRTKIGLRNIICSLQKEKKGWWKRLLKSEEKHPYIKVDWNKWCDDDEEESEASTGSYDDFDGVNDGGESDDDNGMLYLPDLEKLRGTKNPLLSDEETGKGDGKGSEPRPASYSYTFFRLIFALASMYSAMLLTGWTSAASDSSELMDVGWTTVWVRVCTELVTAVLYIWTLVAPLLFPDRDFS